MTWRQAERQINRAIKGNADLEFCLSILRDQKTSDEEYRTQLEGTIRQLYRRIYLLQKTLGVERVVDAEFELALESF